MILEGTGQYNNNNNSDIFYELFLINPFRYI